VGKNPPPAASCLASATTKLDEKKMSLTVILNLIVGVLQFPDAISKLLAVLRQTPAEQQAALVATMLAEAQNFQKTGRPTWN
jgi:hypothetical protein